MRLLRALILAFLLSGTLAGRAECFVGWEKTEQTLQANTPTHNFEVVVDSIDFRPDLTRIYGKITGTPHIAVNVKSIVLSTDGKNAFPATDTDGFDLDKYFQFEETPSFNVEIEFESIAASDNIFIVFLTANGYMAFKYVYPPKYQGS